MNTKPDTTTEVIKQGIERNEAMQYRYKDRSASKTPISMRKAKRRAQNKAAKQSRKTNRKG